MLLSLMSKWHKRFFKESWQPATPSTLNFDDWEWMVFE